MGVSFHQLLGPRTLATHEVHHHFGTANEGGGGGLDRLIGVASANGGSAFF